MATKTKIRKPTQRQIDAADRANLAAAFETLATGIRVGRKGWADRAVGRASKILNTVSTTSKVGAEMMEAFIVHSGPLGPILRAAISPTAEEEYAIVESPGKIEGLPKLDAKDLPKLDTDPLPCACVRYDDGGSFALGSFAGGRAKDGAYSFVRCVETKPDGTTTVHHYTRSPEEAPRG